MHHWTITEDSYLKKNYSTLSNEHLAKALKRTSGSVSFRLSTLGLTRTIEQRRAIWNDSTAVKEYFKRKKFQTWTEEEKKFIQDNYETLTRKEIAAMLKRSYNAVKGMIDKGIVKVYKSPAAIRKQNQRRNIGMFNRGQKPTNTLPKGAITLRESVANGTRDYFIKTAEPNVWMPLNRYLYESVNGPLTKGMLVAYKDGNSMNLLIENLVAISLSDNAKRNAGHKNLSDHYVASLVSKKDIKLRTELMKLPKFIEVKRNSILLQREINKAKKHG